MITVRKAKQDEIDKIIFNPEIYDRITDDNCPKACDLKIPYDQFVYIAGFVNGELASLFAVQEDSKMHFMVLKKFRRSAAELLKASFKVWPYSVYVLIPELYKTVINFAKNNGFRVVGKVPNEHIKNGVLYDSFKLVYEDDSWAL